MYIYSKHCLAGLMSVFAGNGSHLIGLDEIEARMDTPSTRVVLDMGCDRDLVMKVITKRLRTTGT